jgi:hypothetical protein
MNNTQTLAITAPGLPRPHGSRIYKDDGLG